MAEKRPDSKPTGSDKPEGWVDRRWSVPKYVWDQILEMAASTGVHYAELTVMLIEDGISARMREPLQVRDIQDPRIEVQIETESGKKIAAKRVRQVPAKGEILTLEKKAYVVSQRAWSFKGELAKAYLRVRPWTSKRS